MYHGKKPEVSRQQLGDANEGAIGMRNELGHVQWQNRMAIRLFAP